MIGRFAIPMAIALSALTSAAPGLAQPVDLAAQDAARTLGRAGLELFDKGDLTGALAKFEQAYSLYRAPTLGLLSARCLAKAGRLRDASDRYREVIAMNLGESPADAFLEAKKTAEKEGDELLARLPKITIVIEGASLDEVVVLIDGNAIPGDALSAPQLVDPGTHYFEARKGDVKSTVEVAVAEGESASAVLKFEPKPAPVMPVSPTEPPGFFTPAVRRTASFVGIGVGGAGLITGAVLTGLLASKKSDLDSVCSDGRCPLGTEDDVAAYNGLRLGSTISYVAGAAFAGAGVVLLLTAPRAAAPPAKGAASRSEGVVIVRPSISLGLSSITLEGAF